jgi:limonene-1,2-epoxide hydrolase
MVPAGSDNEQLVLDFFAAMGPDLETFKQTYRKYLAENVEWESVGFDHHSDLQDALTYLDTLAEQTGMAYCDINVINIGSAGDLVFTERVDTMRTADGSKIMDFRVAGVLEVRGDKIYRYTDYLDSLGTATQLQSLAAEMGHTAVAP